ncbi:phenolic glucoside malonyltransferase 1-like [Cannabis sativa]|uniref:phenolic glucoside malonyltransferase 1 n=1 Tax=Cannabis sativa TaxID=3483 RepID=UPI0011E03C37|nr:phenolic glucoside malonyltransferase 1 [Cannabis sativa]XP_060964073.1 phenolic glucoside malonyltransferase 1-like [Cannabis sativa]
MAMASLKILEETHVAPYSVTTTTTTTNSTLPLTSFDTYWFKFPPAQCLYLYSLPKETTFFLNSLLPKLKHSLSLTLQHFLPLAGKLTWPQHSPKPIALYTPGDVVSLSIAESNADFDTLSSNQPFQASKVRPLLSPLHVSETGVSIMALKITVFPNKGFCIGLTTHHGLVDGKSAAMFMKSWAYLSSQENPQLPPLLPEELTPFYDRTVIKDPSGFEMKVLNYIIGDNPGSTSSDCRNNPKLFEFESFQSSDLDELYRAIFELSRSDIDKLRRKVSNSNPNELHLSSFVLTYAYIFDCFLKATTEDKTKSTVFILFTADYRNRLTPPVPGNYLGNCVVAKSNFEDMREHVIGKEKEGVDSFTAIVMIVSDLVKSVGKEKDLYYEIEKDIVTFPATESDNSCHVGVAGSPSLGFYNTDFGWGRPKKFVVVSIENGAISMAECGDGSGGIEVGLVLKKHQMDHFASLFHNGLSHNNNNNIV